MKTKIVEIALCVTITLCNMHAHAALFDARNAVCTIQFRNELISVHRSHETKDKLFDQLSKTALRDSDFECTDLLNSELGYGFRDVFYTHFIFYNKRLIGAVVNMDQLDVEANHPVYEHNDDDFLGEEIKFLVFDADSCNEIKSLASRMINQRLFDTNYVFNHNQTVTADEGVSDAVQNTFSLGLIARIKQWFGFSSLPSSGTIVKRS